MARYIFAIALVTLALNNLANAQTDLSKAEATADKFVSPVYSWRAVDLREGVAADDFEAFVKDEFAKAFNRPTHGIRAFIIKGDRGTSKGEYKLVVFFASREVRDKYFPVEDGEAAEALQDDATPTQIATAQKLATFADLGEYTDYVAIAE